MESGWKATTEISPNCPRCGCSSTKFCYYNNYSLTQPRYFCKGCRRYWTKGGSLRNVPVGGGCRKNRRGNNKTLSDPILRTNNVSSSTSSSLLTEYTKPNIDLALVYANFLNQKPGSQKIGFDPLENSRILSNVEVGSSSLNLSELELGFKGCLNLHDQLLVSSTSTSVTHFGEFELDSMQTLPKDRVLHDDGCVNFELPPLPGEEDSSSHDDHVMWSNSEMMMNLPFQVTQPPPPPFLAPDQIHHADLLSGNWSPFDFPRDASFSRPC
ncbi:hypothetical protein RYX36_018445 [Vicia faba]